jgi:hypothetical protein
MADVTEQVRKWGGSFGDPAQAGAREGRTTITTVAVPSPDGGRAVEVTAGPDGGQLLVEHGFEVSAAEVDWGAEVPTPMPSFAETVERLVEGSPGLLACEVEGGGGRYRIELFHPLYADGLSEQSFKIAVAEVAKARRAIDRLVEEIGAHRTFVADLAATERESKETLDRLTQEVEAAVAAPTADSAPAPAGGPTASPAPAAAPWSATHVTPPNGIYAWSEPDGSRAPSVTLDPGLELRVAEWNGAWARVEASNGWSGWVDGRALIERTGP